MKKNSYATADECVLKLEVTKRTFLISITPDCNRGVRQSERERDQQSNGFAYQRGCNRYESTKRCGLKCVVNYNQL